MSSPASDAATSGTRTIGILRSGGLMQPSLPLVAGLGLAASYLLSWDLWSVRTEPPNLPAVEALNIVDLGLPLVAAALLAVVVPRVGAVAHTTLLVWAVLADQIRLQPGIVSLGLLLVVAGWPERLQVVGRWHLATLWFWAGLHKVLSAGWPEGGASFIAGAAGAPGLRSIVVIVVPFMEIGLGLLALRRRTWPMLRVLGPLFHVGVVLLLAAVWWNTVVWPWNLALAAAIPLLFRSAGSEPQEAGREHAPATAAQRTRRPARWHVAVAALLAVYPLGFYSGHVDAYLAHNLYSSNTAEATVCTDQQETGLCPAFASTWETLNAPLPPEDRLFRAWFAQQCSAGERLVVSGINTRLSERQVTEIRCAETAPDS